MAHPHQMTVMIVTDVACAGAFPSQLVGPTYRNAKRNAIEPPIETKRLKANQDITAREVRLVSTDGTHRVLPLAEALTAAREAKLDLVQVAGAACELLSSVLPQCIH